MIGPATTSDGAAPDPERSPPARTPSSASSRGGATGDVRPLPDSPTTAVQLAELRTRLRGALRQFPDFPSAGIVFEDIMPLFADPALHDSLLSALTLHCQTRFSDPGRDRPIDAVVALESRGFLFGPSLAMRLGAAFVPVRKQGKLPGRCVSAEYRKEYGVDTFEMQVGAIKSGWRVVVVDDLIATGGSAAAAGDLVKSLGGTLLEYIFLIELEFLDGRSRLDAPVFTLLSKQ